MDIYLLTRWDIDISLRFKYIFSFKIIAYFINLLVWIVFFLLAIVKALNIIDTSKYVLYRGMNILEAILSFVIMLGMTLAGVGLGRRVRNMMNHTPKHLIPWIIISIFTTACRFISHLLILFSQDLWGYMGKSTLW
jgi:hypothetical protein